jgi:hypothetical protein
MPKDWKKKVNLKTSNQNTTLPEEKIEPADEILQEEKIELVDEILQRVKINWLMITEQLLKSAFLNFIKF